MNTSAIRKASFTKHYQDPPQQTDADGTRTWITRGANFVVVLSEAMAGAVLRRPNNSDESMILLPPRVSAAIEAGAERIDAAGDTLTIVPPGPSAVTMKSNGRVVRLFSSKARDLAEAASNAADYASGAPEAAPAVAWPDPPAGFRLRHYSLPDYWDPKGERMQPRLFRCTSLMVNVLPIWKTRRGTTGLSPHSHADFEQGSLALAGSWVHYLRYPWTPNIDDWRPDDHAEFSSPSLLVVPAGVIHTSRDVGEGDTWLVDIFSPPRLDFSLKPRFVLNADEYPLPPDASSGQAKATTEGHLLAWQRSAG